MKIYELKLSNSLKRRHAIWNAKNNSRKALDVLSGITLGIIADGSINSQEASFFKEWVHTNREELPLKLINELLPLLHKIESADHLDEQELNELLKLILNFSGASINNSGILLSEDPDEPSNVGKTAEWYFYKETLSVPDLSNSEFTLTGNFSSGPKSHIASLINSLNSKVKPKQPSNNSDYLIVGEKGSDQWVCSQLGNSMLKAISMQEKGHHIKIISESSFLSSINEPI